MDKEQEANSLRPVTQQDMVKIRDRLEQHLPYSVIVYNALQVGLRYEGLLDSRKETILYAEDSSLVVLSSAPPEVEQMAATGRLGFGVLIPGAIEDGLVYSLTSSPKILPRIPKGFEMRKIDVKDAQHILDHWQHSFLETVDSYSRLLEVVPSFAIYRTQEDSAESEFNSAKSQEKYKTHSEESIETQDNDDQSTLTKPVSWTHLSTAHAITNTFTLSKYRRLGLSRAVSHAIATQMVQDTGRAFAFISDDNEASIKLHEYLGFTKQCEIAWQYYQSSK